MNKKTIGNTMAVSGGIFSGVLGFSALISGMVLLSNQPYVSYFHIDDAEKLANDIAQAMGYKPETISIEKLGYDYHLKPYDAFRYHLTGHFPADQFTKDPAYGYYSVWSEIQLFIGS
jgi:hypothetical protein